jgi:hypothetical protein
MDPETVGRPGMRSDALRLRTELNVDHLLAVI